MLIHPISFAQYRKIEAISNSVLKHFQRTPAHAYWEMTHPKESTPAMLLGNLTDHLLFGTEFAYAVSPFDSFRTDAAKEWKLAQKEAGIAIFTDETVDRAMKMVAKIKSHPQAAEILSDGRSQIALTWEMEVSGQPIVAKGLVDWVSDTVAALSDLKTTDDASEDAFSKHILNMGYDIQAALYSDLWEWNTGEKLPWTWIVSESSEPHETAVYIASPAILERGRRRYQELLKPYALALSTGEWPGYNQAAIEIDLPAWAK